MISLDDLKTNADSTYAKKTDLSSYATQTWVNNKGYLISSSLSNYYTKDQVDAKITTTGSTTSTPAPLGTVINRGVTSMYQFECPYCGSYNMTYLGTDQTPNVYFVGVYGKLFICRDCMRLSTSQFRNN